MAHAIATIELFLTKDEAAKLAALLVATSWDGLGEVFGHIYDELMTTGAVDDGFDAVIEDDQCNEVNAAIVLRRSEDA